MTSLCKSVPRAVQRVAVCPILRTSTLLVRYRPQTWMHGLSRSVMPDTPADDQAISLIEGFLGLNSGSIPAMVVGILNPPQIDYA